MRFACMSTALLFYFCPLLGAGEPDILIADFEGSDYGDWKAEGTAFGKAPARGKFNNQMDVAGYLGKGLVNTFNGGDAPTGKLTSPEFKIERKFITFLIGGGGYEGLTCMNLVVDGKAVRSASGPNTKPGGSEVLSPMAWDVAEFSGKTATLEIVDAAKDGWGHINVDHIVQSDRKETPLRAGVVRDILAAQRFLNFPVKGGAPKRQVKVSIGTKAERVFEIELADSDPQWWAPLDIGAWTGKTLTLTADKLPEDSKALSLIEQSDTLKNGDELYRERLRPQFHFSAKRGWLNDPNGLVFFNGEYHLFFQHNPYGWNWGNMHWGHAVSRDLVRWQELGEALYPDGMGAMFSGSAVVDANNSSGFGQDGKPAQVLLYTAFSKPATQCVAYSIDGRNYTKFSGNPVVKQISDGNRDPKVIWHEPTKQWVMTLYAGFEDPAKKDKNGKPAERHTIQFLTSPNLKDWKITSQIEGLFECPDFFELPVDGNAANKKWVLTAASSEYMLGTFDGAAFTPQSGKLRGHAGQGFYAAQTFSNEPKNRCIQIGWMRAPSPGMPFNQSMTLPLELTLRSTAEGPRLCWQPVAELESLRDKSHALTELALKPGDANPLAAIKAELLELRADFEPGDASEVSFVLRGIPVVFDIKRQDVIVNGHRAFAPLRDGRQRVIIYLDRTTIEVFASDGHTYVPCPVIPKAENLSVEAAAKGGNAKIHSMGVFELSSAWNQAPQ